MCRWGLGEEEEEEEEAGWLGGSYLLVLVRVLLKRDTAATRREGCEEKGMGKNQKRFWVRRDVSCCLRLEFGK
jgi:hypothetical protein